MMKSILVAVASSVVATGCFVGSDSAPSSAPDGTLTVDWTINGVKDADQCQQSAATSIDVTVETMDGSPMGEFQERCAVFATSIDLPPGRYAASALLLDDHGGDRTTSVPIDPFTILENSDLDVPIDFPARSFK